MINLPFKTIPITDFKLHELVKLDYNHNSEFEFSFNKQFKKEFRVVEFKLPEDAEILAVNFFTLRTDNITTFTEFNKYNKKDWVIRFVCQADNWSEVQRFEFGYYYFTGELLHIKLQIYDLEEKFNKKVKELNEIKT